MNSNIFKLKLEPFEAIWFIVSIASLILVSIITDGSVLGIITTLTGMLNVLLVAKRSMWNYLFGIINVVLYAYISYKTGYGGDFVTFTFYYIPLQFVGIYTWKNHIKVADDNAEVISKKLTPVGWIILILNLIIGTYLTMIILPVITNIFNMPINQLPLVDAFTTYAGITAGVLMAKRYSEQWYIWILVNVGAVIMWITLLQKEVDAPAMVVMWGAYLLNAIYGLYKWNKN